MFFNSYKNCVGSSTQMYFPPNLTLYLHGTQPNNSGKILHCGKPTTMFLSEELDIHHKVHHFIKK
jgi:hypothetical protein